MFLFSLLFDLINHFIRNLLSNFTNSFFYSFFYLKQLFPYLILTSNFIHFQFNLLSFTIHNPSLFYYYKYLFPKILIKKINIFLNFDYFNQKSFKKEIKEQFTNLSYFIIQELINNFSSNLFIKIDKIHLNLTLKNFDYFFLIKNITIEKENDKISIFIKNISNKQLKIQNINIELVPDKFIKINLKNINIEFVLILELIYKVKILEFSNKTNSNSSNINLQIQIDKININYKSGLIRCVIENLEKRFIDNEIKIDLISLIIGKKRIIELFNVNFNETIDKINKIKITFFKSTVYKINKFFDYIREYIEEEEDLTSSIINSNSVIGSKINEMDCTIYSNYIKKDKYCESLIKNEEEKGNLIRIREVKIENKNEEWKILNMEVEIKEGTQRISGKVKLKSNENKYEINKISVVLDNENRILGFKNEGVNIEINKKPKKSDFEVPINLMEVILNLPIGGEGKEYKILYFESLWVNITVNKEEINVSELISGEIYELLYLCNFVNTRLIFSEKWIYYPDTIGEGFIKYLKHMYKEIKEKNYREIMDATPAIYIRKMIDIFGKL